MSKDVIKELNAFLKGQYMGIHAYENLIQHEKDMQVRNTLQKIQQDHKLHAALVAERIQNIGGRPVDDEGIIGTVQEIFSKISIANKNTQEILKSALKGEDLYGIHFSSKMVEGDLDDESNKLIQGIISEDQKHVDELNNLLH